jgi:hypothetical protein
LPSGFLRSQHRLGELIGQMCPLMPPDGFMVGKPEALRCFTGRPPATQFDINGLPLRMLTHLALLYRHD